METIEIIGYKRANLGKKESKKLREEGNVPCVVYGGKDQIHFHAPMILFRDLVYTPGANFVKLNIEGEEKDAILQDIQFHPVSDKILHVDFYQLSEDKEVSMEIPVVVEGSAPGVLLEGGTLIISKRKLKVRALPKNLPDVITVNISSLNLGDKISAADLDSEDFTILHPDNTVVCKVRTSRASMSLEEELEEQEEGKETSEETEASSEGEKSSSGEE